jgi:hypothetical protein
MDPSAAKANAGKSPIDASKFATSPISYPDVPERTAAVTTNKIFGIGGIYKYHTLPIKPEKLEGSRVR